MVMDYHKLGEVDVRLQRMIYERTGITPEQLKDMHTSDIEKKLNLKPPSIVLPEDEELLYFKFVSPGEYARRERKLDRLLRKHPIK